MSEINCNVVNDILPLYAEDMISDDTRLLIDEHLAKCAKCRKTLDSINQGVNLKPETSTTVIVGMKKKIKNLITVIVLAAVALTIVIVVLMTPFFRRIGYQLFYFGDRITAKFSVTIDDKTYDFNDYDVTCFFHENYKKQELTTHDNETYSLKGNEYGSYIFTIKCDSENVKINISHLNWWEIDNYSFDIDINTKTETMNMEVCNNFVNDDAQKVIYTSEFTVQKGGGYSVRLFG